jgi:7-cyano-7-deazaguanine synthase in queuosine biosynthesis
VQQVVFKYTEDDKSPINNDDVLTVLLDVVDTDPFIQTNLQTLLEKGIPFTPFQRELAYLAAAIYATDRRTSRKTAYNHWTRNIQIYFPVIDLEKWKQVESILNSVISFVTGDRWSITFYPTDFRHDTAENNHPDYHNNIDAVSLLSGGLDSFIGAIDLLEMHSTNIMFVSHHSSGSMEHSFQKNVLELLTANYSGRVHQVDFFAQPFQSKSSELTSRSRSFMYFVMGIITAESVGCSTFTVPENGFISLNIPLTRNRLGSLSSRTTHPHFVAQFQRFIDQLGIDVTVSTPYRFKTKGEMLVDLTTNSSLLQTGYNLTMSCSTASSHRFSGHSPKVHCGKCIPCIVRRAALHRANLAKDAAYITDVLTVSNPDASVYPDLWAIKAAIQRYKQEPPTIFDVLGSATLSNDVEESLSVYKRGIEELDSFLH